VVHLRTPEVPVVELTASAPVEPAAKGFATARVEPGAGAPLLTANAETIVSVAPRIRIDW
jgi:hypothetical protein